MHSPYNIAPVKSTPMPAQNSVRSSCSAEFALRDICFLFFAYMMDGEACGQKNSESYMLHM